MTALLLLLAAAWADTRGDLARLADGDLPEANRMALFEQMAADYNTHHPVLLDVARDSEADARERWVAIRLMGHTQAAVSDTLLALCDDDLSAIRVAAASALGDMQAGESVERLSEMLSDPAIVARHAAAVALGQIGDARALPALTRALDDPSNFYRGSSLWVRPHFADAIGAIGDRQGVPVLIDHFDDIDPLVVEASLRNLKQIVGYDFAEGRTEVEHMEAWRRWWSGQ